MCRSDSSCMLFCLRFEAASRPRNLLLLDVKMKTIALCMMLALFSLCGCSKEPEVPVTTTKRPNRMIISIPGRRLSPESAGTSTNREEVEAVGGARAVLDKAIAEAKTSERNLFVHFGAPWSDWSGKFEKFLDQNMDLFEEDFHFVKIDTEEMEGGSKVYEEFLDGRDGGLPWIVILDGDGKELITSIGSDDKNIACPTESHEIEHFGAMIKASSDASEEQLGTILGKLKEYVETLQD